MSVPAGYKATEVGVIPDDWDVLKLSEVFSISAGGDYDPKIASPIFATTHPFPVYANALKANAVHSFASEHRHPARSVTVSARGMIGFATFRDHPFTAIGRLLVLQPTESNDGRFFAEFINQRVEFAVESTGVPQLTAPQIGAYLIAVPPVPEQTAIAEALSDVDEAIAAQEAVIAKKRALKTATMQALLSGTHRLPGYAGDWEEMRLGDTAILKARIGWQGLTTDEYLEAGDVYLVTGTDFQDGYVDWTNCCFVDEWRYKQDRNIQLRPRDVLVTKDGTLGKIALVPDLPGRATLNSGVFVIRPRNDCFVPEFFYFILRSRVFSEFMDQLSAGSTITHLYQKDFVNFRFRAPPTSEEQVAIATMLADLDAEMADLKATLAKLRDLKTGMMQQLLTGKIRLV